MWIGATPELDTGTKNSAKHLHLIPNVKVDGLEETSSLLRLAQDAGMCILQFRYCFSFTIRNRENIIYYYYFPKHPWSIPQERVEGVN